VTSSLPLTGERTVPGIAVENYWFQVTRTLCDLRRWQASR